VCGIRRIRKLLIWHRCDSLNGCGTRTLRINFTHENPCLQSPGEPIHEDLCV
jgi:hypothetical protein